MANAEIAIKRTLEQFEGGFFDSKFDNGKATMWGITEKVARRHGYAGDMKNLSKNEALRIYKTDYWNPLKLDTVDQNIANEIYDTAVNCGVGTAGRVFQKALNILNIVLLKADKQKELYSELVVDGKIGLKTLQAYKTIVSRKEENFLYAWVIFYRAIYYEKIMSKNKTQKSFCRSWTRRLFEFLKPYK